MKTWAPNTLWNHPLHISEKSPYILLKRAVELKDSVTKKCAILYSADMSTNTLWKEPYIVWKEPLHIPGKSLITPEGVGGGAARRHFLRSHFWCLAQSADVTHSHVYMCIYGTHSYACIYIYMYKYMYNVYTQICAYMCIHVYVHVYIQYVNIWYTLKCLYLYIFIYIYMYIYHVYAHICAYMYIHIYVHIYTYAHMYTFTRIFL